MKLPKDVKLILAALRESGYRADVVGGPVRDFLLGKTPDDYDITTSAAPEETKAVFKNYKTVDTGIKHGTVTLVLGSSPYEITTYRIDGEYKDARHPESVRFTKLIEQDLSRRDFTMNAIAYNEIDGLTDPFGGREDIFRRIIRTVGDPDKRFTEDALRVLRGMRFAARLGFDIDPETAAAMHRHRQLLTKVSSERIYTEWKKLLSGDFALPVLSEFSDIVEVFLPEISRSPLPDEGRFYESDYLTRMLALFSFNDNAAVSFSCAMKRLKTDSRTFSLGKAALEAFGKLDLSNMIGLGKLLSLVGEDAAKLTVSLEILLGTASPDTLCELDRYLENKMPYKLSHLNINGNDLKREGFEGTAIGETLQFLLREVIEKKLSNGREELISRARELLTK